MPAFSPQHYLSVGRRLGVSEGVLRTALDVADRITAGDGKRAVVFTLAHLSFLTGVPYGRLRDWVGRRDHQPYREYFLAKARSHRKARAPARSKRRIAIPLPGLMLLQRWIVERILHTVPRHHASVAFHRRSDIVEAARLHCRCRWLIKLDVENFFESVYEPKIFSVFLELGYPRLLAFELARLCTRVVPHGPGKDLRRTTFRHMGRGPEAYHPFGTFPRPAVEANPEPFDELDEPVQPDDWEEDEPDDNAGEGGSGQVTGANSRLRTRNGVVEVALPLGSLPQGAPTSPLLANLAVRSLDESIEAIARDHDLVYTRYADDIALSTRREDFDRSEASKVIGKVLRALEYEGLRPHRSKTRVVPPGARKIVLGLMVDGPKPRLTREYRNKLRLHAYMLGELGIPPSEHAKRLRFRSVLSMRRHIEGKVAHARRVENAFAERIARQLGNVNWTL